MDDLPEGLAEIYRQLKQKRFRNDSEMQAWLKKQVEAYNRSPQVDLNGLSPVQAHEVRHDPWDGSGPMMLHGDLPLEVFEQHHANVVLNARIVLRDLREHGPVKLTPAGYLPRAFVARLLDVLHWLPGELEDIREYNKVINELDAHGLLELREVLLYLKYLRILRGELRITKAGIAALDPAQAGALAVSLFRANLRELKFIDSDTDEDERAQAAMPMLLWTLFMKGRGWFREQDLWRYCDLSGRREPLAFGRAVLWLVNFGLLETSRTPGRVEEFYRPSRLLERFITWRYPHPWPREPRTELPLDRFVTPLVYGELSHEQAAAILRDPVDGTGPLRIAADLAPQDFSHAPALGVDNARRLLELLARDGSWQVMPDDLLAPAVVMRIAESLEWWPGYHLDQEEKPSTELDFSAIMNSRLNLQETGLIARKRWSLVITEEGRRLMAPEQMGELAARLLAHDLRDAGYEEESPDDSIDLNRPARRRARLIVWKLSRVAPGWHSLESLVQVLTLPEMKEEMGVSWNPDVMAIIMGGRINSLADLGLMERDLDSTEEHPRYRRTALFEQMLSWRL